MNPRILLALAGGLILALTAVCFSADTQERVAPVEDTARLHLSVVGVPGSAQYQNVLTWFKSDDRLSSLRASTHFHAIATGSPMYDERYRPNIHGLPTIRIQDGRGIVLYESWGDAIPKSPIALANAIENETSQLCDPPCLPWRRKMEKQQAAPDPGVITPEDLMQDDMPIPDAFTPAPDIEPESEGIPTWVCIVLAAASAAGGFVGAIVGKIKQEIQA
jgi:hypothetical protein